MKNLERFLDGFAGEVLTELAQDVANQAKINCPVRLGTLRNSITWSVDGTSAVVGSNVPYAAYVEYGTGIYNLFGEGRQTPWVYYDEELGRYFKTEGQRPSLFLSRAVSEVLSRW